MTQFHLSKNKVRNTPEYRKVPILDTEKGTIAGVRFAGRDVDDALRRPVPPERRNEIMDSLDKMKFHVMFRPVATEERKRGTFLNVFVMFD